MMMKVLTLIIRKKWFDMILSGRKREEYRERKPYWLKRLINKNGLTWKYLPRKDAVLFYEGYRKERRAMLVEIIDIGFGTGRPDWGAEAGKTCIIIQLGKILIKSTR